MFKKFFQNTRKPEGFQGRIMLKMMNSGHERVAKWGFTHIQVNPSDRVLDIGCGGGKNIKTWLSLVPKGGVIGIDYSQESVKKSKSFNQAAIDQGRCEILEANVLQMPFKENSFNFISAFETVYFWPEIEDVFHSIKKILKVGGKFMIVNEASDDRDNKWVDIIGGMKIYTMEELKQMVENAGLTPIVCEQVPKKGWLVLVAQKNN